MNWINRHKRLVFAFVSILLIFTMLLAVNMKFRPVLLSKTLGFVLVPAEKAVTTATTWVSEQAAWIAGASKLEAENKRLQEAVDTLTAENKRLRLVDAENQRLTDLLKIDAQYPALHKVGANTVASDTTNWFTTFIIDKGEQDGLSKDMAVMASGGLIGRIVEASDSFSTVETLINDASAISVKCVRTEDLGFVSGDISLMRNGLCRMDFVSLSAQLMEGDELITSQLGDIYPAGITVGYVTEIKMDSRGLTKYAIVRPVADFQNIETVLVVTDKPKPVKAPAAARGGDVEP